MTSALKQIYQIVPTEDSAIELLEEIRWRGQPVCPYCGSTSVTSYANDNRYHCNTCLTSFSVTVNSPFHKTKAPLQKWFYLILLLAGGEDIPPVRKIAEDISVTKDTALRMIQVLRNNYSENTDLYNQILNKLSNAKETP